MSPDVGDPDPTELIGPVVDDGRKTTAAADNDAAALADPATAVPVVAGTFAIFNDGRGGFVVVFDTGNGPERRHIPAAIVKLATGGGLLGRLGRLGGGIDLGKLGG